MTEMNYDFIKEIVDKPQEEPSTRFKLGFAAGVIGVGVLFIAAEIGALCFAAFLFGFSLTFWQALAIILIYKYLLLQINKPISS